MNKKAFLLSLTKHVLVHLINKGVTNERRAIKRPQEPLEEGGGKDEGKEKKREEKRKRCMVTILETQHVFTDLSVICSSALCCTSPHIFIYIFFVV